MTAVEWLIKDLTYEKNQEFFIRINQEDINVTDVCNQAKQMEREQIENAYISGQTNGVFVDIENAKYYYTETFKK